MEILRQFGRDEMLRRLSAGLCLACLLGATVPCWSQMLPSTQQSRRSSVDCAQVTDATATRPDYQLDRSQEDWSSLCDPAVRGDDPWDRIKYIEFGGSSYVSFGGELRGSYERYRNYSWGSGLQDPDGYYLNRVIGHADLHLGPRVRVFAEFQSGLEFGRNGGPRPVVDEDKLDVSQLSLELNPSTHNDRPSISLRLGRQELNYGEGTLVSTRELNVRRPFDGVKLVFQPQRWRIDVFAVKPVATRNGFFDDAPDHRQTFWGVWATKTNDLAFLRRVDLYYLGLDRNDAVFDKGTARERRNTLGFNAHEVAGRVTLFQEGDLQFGTFGSGRLTAWKFAQGVSYSPPRIRYQPIFGLQGAISSGDANPTSANLHTFYPLFPKGLYYGYMLFTSGSLNAIVIHPTTRLQLSKKLSLDLDSFFFLRQSTSDGLYSQSGMFLRTGQTSRAHYIGATQDLSIVWQVDRHATVQGLAGYYEVGSYLRETQPPGKNASYFSVTTNYRF
jgi:Alginate export